MKKSKLDPHAEWITTQLRKGSTIQKVRDLLDSKKGCSVEHETLRKWIQSRKPVGYTGRQRGRPKSEAAVSFSFLGPDHKPIPLFVTRFFSWPRDRSILPQLDLDAWGHLILNDLGIHVDENIPKHQWVFQSKALRSMADLEILMLAYILSDLGVPPLPATPKDVNTKPFERWWFPLLQTANRLKEAISTKDEILVGSLFTPDSGPESSKS